MYYVYNDLHQLKNKIFSNEEKSYRQKHKYFKGLTWIKAGKKPNKFSNFAARTLV
jgi:hypothetical protein